MIIIAGLQATAWLIGPAFMALIIVIAVAPVQGWKYATKSDSLVASAPKQLAALGVGPEQLQQAAASLNLGKLAVGRS